MRVRLLLFTVITPLIVAASTSAATLPHRTLVGPAQGVQASLSGERVTIRFTGASAAWGKRRAGQTASVSCEPAPETALLLRADTGASGLGVGAGFGDDLPEDFDLADLGIAKLASSGASVKAKVRDAARADLCEVRVGVASSADSAWAVLTPRGAIALEEQQRELRMADVIYAAAPKRAYRAAADVVALGGGEVVALDDPNGTPPAGKIGYWSKGRAVSLVSASATGRRLAIQDLGGGMVRSNAFEALMGWTPAEKPKRSVADAADAAASPVAEEEDEERYAAGEGVYSHLEGGDVVFRFTGKAAKAYRRIAGRRVMVMCMKAPERPLLGGTLQYGGAPVMTKVRVRARGGTIRGKAPAGSDDLCAVVYEGHEVAFAFLTPAGRRYIFDFAAPLAVLFDDSTPWDVAPAQATRYPGVATVVAAHPGVVGLPTPGAVLAAGKIGVWTDAAQQALIVFSGPDGLRYVFADEGAGVVRTNLFTTLLSVFALLIAAPSGASGG